MAITAADILYKLSGGTGNTDPTASRGGAMSTAGGGVITGGVAGNLWDDITGTQATAGGSEFRAFYAHNTHASTDWVSVVYWIDILTSSTDSEFDIALASEAVNVAIVQTLASEASVPTGVTFTRPTSKGTGLSIGTIPHGQFKGLWIKRTWNAASSSAADSGSVRCEGDSGP